MRQARELVPALIVLSLATLREQGDQKKDHEAE